jgi:hypothetical protein
MARVVKIFRVAIVSRCSLPEGCECHDSILVVYA